MERIQPGEVSWVEIQPSRERVEGWFLSDKDDDIPVPTAPGVRAPD